MNDFKALEGLDINDQIDMVFKAWAGAFRSMVYTAIRVLNPTRDEVDQIIRKAIYKAIQTYSTDPAINKGKTFKGFTKMVVHSEAYTEYKTFYLREKTKPVFLGLHNSLDELREVVGVERTSELKWNPPDPHADPFEQVWQRALEAKLRASLTPIEAYVLELLLNYSATPIMAERCFGIPYKSFDNARTRIKYKWEKLLMNEGE